MMGLAGLAHVVKLDDGADHAGAEVALLIWGDVESHDVVDCRGEKRKGNGQFT